MPEYIEVGFHDYEASCEDYFCNLVGPDVDQTVCPASPSSPATVAQSTVTGIAVGGGAVILLLLIYIFFMISKEKQGKPVFYNLATAKGQPKGQPQGGSA